MVDHIPPPKWVRKYCSPQKDIIGLLDFRRIEQYHSYHYIKSNILQEKESVLFIGSPHLEYWFETPDAPRMKDFLDSTKTVRVCVILYNGCNGVQRNIQSGLDLCKNEYDKRFEYKITNETSNLSYIYYKFKNRNKTYSRCLIGFQSTEYADRPFIEFVNPIEFECQFVKSIVAAHTKLFERKDVTSEDSSN